MGARYTLAAGKMGESWGPGAAGGRVAAAGVDGAVHTILYSMPFLVCVQEGGRLGLARWAGPARAFPPLLPFPKPPKGGRRSASVPSRSCPLSRPPGI